MILFSLMMIECLKTIFNYHSNKIRIIAIVYLEDFKLFLHFDLTAIVLMDSEISLL